MSITRFVYMYPPPPLLIRMSQGTQGEGTGAQKEEEGNEQMTREEKLGYIGHAGQKNSTKVLLHYRKLLKSTKVAWLFFIYVFGVQSAM